MLTRTNFPQVNYKQTKNYCMLASYAVAASAFTGEHRIRAYFEDFCLSLSTIVPDASQITQQHSIPFDPVNDPEEAYLFYMWIYFDNRNKMVWYKGIELIHNLGVSPLFNQSKQAFTIEMIEKGSQNIPHIEGALMSPGLTLANLCLDFTVGQDKYVHSVTVGWDSNGYYYYDVNNDKKQIIPILEDNLLDWVNNQRVYPNATIGNVMIFRPT